MIRHQPRNLVPVVFVFGFAVVAIVFALLGITSSKWSQRQYYDSSVPEDWGSPNLTIYRSPFSVCASNLSQTTTTDDQGITSVGPTTFDYVCARFKPSGVDHTSCELPYVIKKYLNISDTLQNGTITRGDQRLCQQIHYAGNFGIAGSLFVSLGSLLTIGLVLLASLEVLGSSRADDDLTVEDLTGHRQRPTELKRDRVLKQSFIAHTNFTLIVFLIIGTVTTLISQFYGVIALTQSTPNNSDFASSSFGSSTGTDTNFVGNHGPWYQAKGLSVYMTLSWAFALATATLAAMIWRTPSWRFH